MDDLDAALVRAWQSGEEDARQRAWKRLWDVLYTTAERTCRGMGLNPTNAEDCAKDAFLTTLEQVEIKLLEGEIEWRSHKEFLAFVSMHLKRRCLDACRRVRNEQKHRLSLTASGVATEGESYDLQDTLVADALTPEEAMLRDAELRQVEDLLKELRARNTRPSVREVLEMSVHYVRIQLENTCSAEDGTPQALEDLLDAANYEDLKRIRSGLPAYVREQLGISENVFSLRLRHIRLLLQELRKEASIEK